MAAKHEVEEMWLEEDKNAPPEKKPEIKQTEEPDNWTADNKPPTQGPNPEPENSPYWEDEDPVVHYFKRKAEEHSRSRNSINPDGAWDPTWTDLYSAQPG